ncbi:MAG: diguanylate cyclase [Ruminococcus sp.]|nr:diguanylate cyclase [Ruminococcus sp.]
MMTRVYSWINAFICVFVIALIIVAFSFSMPDGNTYIKNYDMSTGWEYEDGTDADMTDPRTNGGEHIVVHRRLSSNEATGGALCFQTSNLFMDIYLDDDLIYTFHPKLSRIEGKYYGDLIHYVNIPFFEGERTLYIDYYELIDTGYSNFRSMKLQSPREYEYDILSENLSKFLVSAVVVIFGIFLVLFGLVFDRDAVHRAESTSLGAFAIIMGVWTNAGSMVIQSLTDDSSFTRLLDYTALMLLPVPILIFVAAFTQSLGSLLFKIPLFAVLLNFVMIYTLVIIGVCDYHQLLILIHGLLVVCVVTSATMLIRAVRRKVRKLNKSLVAAFLLLFVFGAVDLIRYYVYSDLDVAKYSRVGISVFIAVFSVYELRQLFDLTRRSMELEVMEKLAHTDGLTGLLNRNALEELEAQLSQQDSGGCIFVQLDINGLKAINDTYGHSAGDTHIMAAADIIVESFGKSARVFRIGGDEFLIVLEGSDNMALYDEGIKAMTRLEEEYNKTVDPDKRLEIAYGFAEYEGSTRDPEEAERVADMRMYECKARMKAAAANA